MKKLLVALGVGIALSVIPASPAIAGPSAIEGTSTVESKSCHAPVTYFWTTDDGTTAHQVLRRSC